MSFSDAVHLFFAFYFGFVAGIWFVIILGEVDIRKWK